jgi:hypothetical protein
MRGALLFFAEYCKNLNELFLKSVQDTLVEVLHKNFFTKDALLR